jgi:hypothetical protein
VRGARHEIEARVGDGDEHVVQIAGRADLLLRLVERADPALVLLHVRRRGLDVRDAPHGDDARVVRVVGDGDGEGDQARLGAELDRIAALQARGVAVGVVERDALAAAQDVRPVGGALVLEEVAIPGEEHLGVLTGDVVVGQDDVVALGAPDAQEIGRRLDVLPDRLTLRDLQPYHRIRSLLRTGVRQSARARRRIATLTTASSAMRTLWLPLALSASTIFSSAAEAPLSPCGER